MAPCAVEVRLATRVGQAGGDYQYAYVAQGDEPQDEAADVAVAAKDALGSEGTGEVARAVTFDFVPPALLGSASLVLRAASGTILEADTPAPASVALDYAELVVTYRR